MLDLWKLNNVLAVVQKPNSGNQNMNIIIVIVIVVIIVLVASTIFTNKK